MRRSGRFLARIEGPQSGNVLLRRAQHEATRDRARCAAIAGAIVAAKAANQRAVLRRALRDHGVSMIQEQRAVFEAGEARLSRAAHQAASASDLDAVRGIEGDAASAYFATFDGMIRREESTCASAAARVVRRAMHPMRCSLSSTPCSPTIAAPQPKASA